MNVKAEAFQEYNQAAVIDKLLTSLPRSSRASGAAQQGGQDHDRVHRQRGSTGMHKVPRHDRDRRAGAGAFEALSGVPRRTCCRRAEARRHSKPPGVR
jgi:flotillin